MGKEEVFRPNQPTFFLLRHVFVLCALSGCFGSIGHLGEGAWMSEAQSWKVIIAFSVRTR